VCVSVVEQGFQEGLQVGNISGYEKGFAFGVKHGAQLNQEVQAALFLVNHFLCTVQAFCG